MGTGHVLLALVTSIWECFETGIALDRTGTIWVASRRICILDYTE
jgi:hypothetical protein